MRPAALQMAVFSALVGIATIGALAYVAVAQPDHLRQNRTGVAYFTPPVLNPETGEPVSMETLIRHYRGGE